MIGMLVDVECCQSRYSRIEDNPGSVDETWGDIVKRRVLQLSECAYNISEHEFDHEHEL